MLGFLGAGDSHGKRFRMVNEDIPSRVYIKKDLKTQCNQKEFFIPEKIPFKSSVNVFKKGKIKENLTRNINGEIYLELLKKYSVKIVSRVVKKEKYADVIASNIRNGKTINNIEESSAEYFYYDAERGMIDRIHNAIYIGSIKINGFNVPCELGSHISCGRKINCSNAEAYNGYVPAYGIVIKKLLLNKFAGNSYNDIGNKDAFYSDKIPGGRQHGRI